MQSAQFQLHAEIEQRHWWFVARRQILSEVVRAALPPDPSTTIVDVGCGTGANLAGLADDYRCVGIDTSEEAIRLARQRFRQVRFIHGVAPHDLGLAMGRARLIMLCDVLEHVPDDFSLFSELLAAASPGAYFLVTVPAEQALWSEHDESFGHYRRYDRARLAKIWQELAVEELFVSHFNARLYPLIKTVRRVNHWRGHAAGTAGTDFKLPNAMSNDLLTRCFAGERHRLASLAKGESVSPYRAGVSLMALLRRTAGAVEPRHKPLGLPVDFYDPAAALAART